MIIRRGSIYFARLDFREGSEINKTCPVLVISNDINNKFSNTVTIIPLTSNTKVTRSFEVFIPSGEANLPKDSKVKCDQIRTIDISRIANKIGDLSSEFVYAIEIAMKIHLGL